MPGVPGGGGRARRAAGGDRGARRRPHRGRDARCARFADADGGRPAAPPDAEPARSDGDAPATRPPSSGSTSRDAGATRPACAALGIDIGGTKVAGGVVAPDGTILATARRATPGASVSDTEDAIAAVVEELAAGHDGELVGVGVGAAGWFDRTGDTVLFSPHLAWRNSTLRKDLAGRLQRPLWVGNDADAAAWAEYRYGAARGADLALMITLGTGIGGGIVLDGRLRRGLARRRGGVGAHAGRARRPAVRLRQPRLLGAVRQRDARSAQTAREVARTSPAAAARLLERVGRRRPTGSPARTSPARPPTATRWRSSWSPTSGVWLGQGIADLAAVLDPEVVVIGGGVSKLGEMVLAPARDRLDRALPGRGFRPGPRVVVAELGPQAGLVGAADLRAAAPEVGTMQEPGATRLAARGEQTGPLLGGELAGQLLEEQADVGDDAHRLGAAAVGQLGHRRRVDVDADQRDRRRAGCSRSRSSAASSRP